MARDGEVVGGLLAGSRHPVLAGARGSIDERLTRGASLWRPSHESSRCILRRMFLEVLQRSDWDGEPKNLGDMFRLHKQKCGQQLEAACRLVTHALGWELRLEVAGSLQMSQVCRVRDEVLDTSERWKA